MWQIGEADRPNYDLSSISGVGVDGNGRVYVGQSQEMSVRVFDSAGRFLHKFGKQGNGPGELQSVSGVLVHGNEVHVNDASRQLLLSYSLSGVFREQWGPQRFPAAPGTIGAPRHRFVGGYFDVTRIRADSVTSIVLMRPNEPARRQLAVVDLQGSSVAIRTARVTMTLKPPVRWGAMYTVHPRGTSVVILDQPLPGDRDTEAVFNVMQVTPDPDTVFVRSFRYPVRRLTSERWNMLLGSSLQAATQLLAQARRQSPSGRGLPITDVEVREALSALYPTPLPQPPIDDLRLADDGSIWLRQASSVQEGYRVWIVLDGSGSIKSRVRVPASWRVEAIIGNHIYAISTDALDVPLVIKARIGSN